MFPRYLVEKAEKVLSEHFPLGCRATTGTREFALFGEKLQAEVGLGLNLDAGERLDLLKSAGTCVGGVVYPFKTSEAKPKIVPTSPTNDPRRTANASASEDGENGESEENEENGESRDEVWGVKRVSRDQIPVDKVKRIANVLYYNFRTGFSLRNAADLKRFRAADPVLDRESDATLLQWIAGVGCCADGFVYVILKTGQKYLTQLVEGLWKSGVRVVYYEALFERYKSALRKHRFETSAALQNRLRVYFRNYAFYDEYFERTKTPGSEPQKVLGEIERVWQSDEELKLDVLADWTIIPKSKIRAYLDASSKYECRGKGVYAKKGTASDGVAAAPGASESESARTVGARLQDATASGESADVGDGAALELLQRLLSERFANGFRLNSTIEANRLRKYAQETNGEAGAEIARWDDAALKEAVADVGILCEEKVYVVEKTTDETIRSEIESAFDSGARAIFYKSLLERVASALPDFFSLELLKDRIKGLCAAFEGRKIRFAENYLNIYIYIGRRGRRNPTASRPKTRSSRRKFSAFGATRRASASPICANVCPISRRRRSTPFLQSRTRFLASTRSFTFVSIVSTSRKRKEKPLLTSLKTRFTASAS